MKSLDELIADLRSQTSDDHAYDLLWEMGEEIIEPLLTVMLDPHEDN